MNGRLYARAARVAMGASEAIKTLDGLDNLHSEGQPERGDSRLSRLADEQGERVQAYGLELPPLKIRRR